MNEVDQRVYAVDFCFGFTLNLIRVYEEIIERIDHVFFSVLVVSKRENNSYAQSYERGGQPEDGEDERVAAEDKREARPASACTICTSDLQGPLRTCEWTSRGPHVSETSLRYFCVYTINVDIVVFAVAVAAV